MTEATDPILSDAFDRAVRAQAAWYRPGASIEEPSATVEQAAKSLAKDLAQRATESVQERQARARVRVDVYNVFLPVLLDLSNRHLRERKRLHTVVWALSALAASAIALAWLT